MRRFGYTSVVVEGEESAHNAPLALEGITTHAASSRPETGQGGFAILRRYLGRLGWETFRKLPARADIYHLHAPYQFPAVFLRSLLSQAPYIYDAHDFYTDMEPKDSLGAFQRYLLTPLLRLLERICIRRATAVIMVGSIQAEMYRKAYGVTAVVIRNCHDSRLDTAPQTSIRDACGVDDTVFLAVVIGHAKSGRNTAPLLDALTHLPDSVHIAFLGKGYDHLGKDAVSIGLTKRIHILPPVMPWEVVPFVEGADAALILYTPISPNYRASLPNAFFQSVAAKLPLLYPDLPEIRSLSERYGLGICIDPNSPKSITSAILTMLNPQTRQQFQANATRAAQDLTWENEERHLAAIYDQLLGKEA